eukprot:g5002.t2
MSPKRMGVAVIRFLLHRCLGPVSFHRSPDLRNPVIKEVGEALTKNIEESIADFYGTTTAAAFGFLLFQLLFLGLLFAACCGPFQGHTRLACRPQGIRELEQRCMQQEQQLQEREQELREIQQKCHEIQHHWELQAQDAHRQTQQLQEEIGFLRENSKRSEETLQGAKRLEHAVVNIMATWTRGQECMGNMSLGIAPDLRFKLEYYGSTQHVFNELELEGTVKANGAQLTFQVLRSSSSHDGEDDGIQMARPLEALLCGQGENTWIVLLDFSASAPITETGSTDRDGAQRAHRETAAMQTQTRMVTMKHYQPLHAPAGRQLYPQAVRPKQDPAQAHVYKYKLQKSRVYDSAPQPEVQVLKAMVLEHQQKQALKQYRECVV